MGTAITTLQFKGAAPTGHSMGVIGMIPMGPLTIAIGIARVPTVRTMAMGTAITTLRMKLAALAVAASGRHPHPHHATTIPTDGTILMARHTHVRGMDKGDA